MYRWLLEVEIAADLVADGIDLSDNILTTRYLQRAFPLARSSGINVRVIEAPNQDDIEREQGYK